MQASVWRPGRLVLAVITCILPLSISQPCSGQRTSKQASVYLTARLESISVSAVPFTEFDLIGQGHGELGDRSVLITASCALSSERTLVRIVENGRPLFFGTAWGSNRPVHRVYQLSIPAPDGRSGREEFNVQRRSVSIIVQAF
jgi:hypothetical protein